MNKPLHIDWDEHQDAATNAQCFLPRLISDYFARGREILAENPGAAELHALRLATKRLRYTLELFRPCYGPGLAARIDSLRLLQQLLGEINDTAAAERALRTVWSGRNHPQRARVEKFLKQRGEAKASEFRKQWVEVFDAPGQERWWSDYLARQAHRSRG